MILFSIWKQAFCHSVILRSPEEKKKLDIHILTGSRFSQERSNIMEKLIVALISARS